MSWLSSLTAVLSDSTVLFNGSPVPPRLPQAASASAKASHRPALAAITASGASMGTMAARAPSTRTSYRPRDLSTMGYLEIDMDDYCNSVVVEGATKTLQFFGRWFYCAAWDRLISTILMTPSGFRVGLEFTECELSDQQLQSLGSQGASLRISSLWLIRPCNVNPNFIETLAKVLNKNRYIVDLTLQDLNVAPGELTPLFRLLAKKSLPLLSLKLRGYQLTQEDVDHLVEWVSKHPKLNIYLGQECLADEIFTVLKKRLPENALTIHGSTSRLSTASAASLGKFSSQHDRSFGVDNDSSPLIKEAREAVKVTSDLLRRVVDSRDEGRYMAFKHLLLKKFVLQEVPQDGNCFFSAMSLATTGSIGSHAVIRKAIVRKLRAKPPSEIEKLLPALPQGTTWEKYCRDMEQLKTWGSNFEIKIAADTFRCPIHVYDVNNKSNRVDDDGTIHTPEEQVYTPASAELGEMGKTIHLLYSNRNHFDLLVPL